MCLDREIGLTGDPKRFPVGLYGLRQKSLQAGFFRCPISLLTGLRGGLAERARAAGLSVFLISRQRNRFADSLGAGLLSLGSNLPVLRRWIGGGGCRPDHLIHLANGGLGVVAHGGRVDRYFAASNITFAIGAGCVLEADATGERATRSGVRCFMGAHFGFAGFEILDFLRVFRVQLVLATPFVGGRQTLHTGRRLGAVQETLNAPLSGCRWALQSGRRGTRAAARSRRCRLKRRNERRRRGTKTTNHGLEPTGERFVVS